jgi:DNA-binding beta-propeller fold protein YncE
VLRALTLAALLLALGAGAAPARVAGGTPVAYVAVEKDAQLVAVDLETGRVTDRIAVPAGPRSVTATGDLRHVLVTSPPSGAVTLVDSFKRRVVKIFEGFGRPLDVAVEGESAYVTDASRNELVVLDLVRRRIVSRIRVPRRPQNVAVGDVALVTHAPPIVKLTIVELGRPGGPRRSSIHRLSVSAEGGPNDVSKQPDSAYAYVTGHRSGGAAGIDWGRGGIPRWWREVGVRVEHVAFDYFHGRRVWVSDSARGGVLALSSETGRVFRRLGGCPGAGPIALGGQAWVVATCKDAGALAIWDTRTWKRTLVPVGERPHGVAVAVLP